MFRFREPERQLEVVLRQREAVDGISESQGMRPGVGLVDSSRWSGGIPLWSSRRGRHWSHGRQRQIKIWTCIGAAFSRRLNSKF